MACSTAAAPPSPGRDPGVAGPSVSVLPMLAVMTGIPATLSVMPELVPGIVTGASAPMGAVKETGDDVPVTGSTAGQLVQPSKLSVRFPESE